MVIFIPNPLLVASFFTDQQYWTNQCRSANCIDSPWVNELWIEFEAPIMSSRHEWRFGIGWQCSFCSQFSLLKLPACWDYHSSGVKLTPTNKRVLQRVLCSENHVASCLKEIRYPAMYDFAVVLLGSEMSLMSEMDCEIKQSQIM